MGSEQAFYKSKDILTKKIDNAYKDNPSWNANNFPEDSDNGPLSETEIQQKRLKKIAYAYDDIIKFKIFLQKHETELRNVITKEKNFIEKMNDFVQKNIDIMTTEMQAYIDKHQIFHRRLRRDGIDATKKPEETRGA